jgi:nitrous oxidase accessory protein NosD
MSIAGWTTYWRQSPVPHAPLGFGVTARSRDDAIRMIHVLGYGRYLPDGLAGVQVAEGVTVAQLDQPHVIANMGPIVVRGMWYPFVSVGAPRGAEEH